MNIDNGQQVSAVYRRGTDQVEGRRWTWLLECLVTIYASVIVVGSIILFMTSTTAEQVEKLITEQNTSALTLWSNLDYYRVHHIESQLVGSRPPDTSLPPGLFDALVIFSRGNGQLIKTLHRLYLSEKGASWDTTWTYLNRTGALDKSDSKFDHYGVNPQTDTTNVVEQGMYQIRLYQAIRDYAQDEANFYKWCLDAVSLYMLPVLYALLGSFLYALRRCTRAASKEEGMPLADRCSPFVVAAIGGIAVSLFSSLIPKSLPLPPLALAFLIGYSTEVFTSRLDSMVYKLKSKRP